MTVHLQKLINLCNPGGHFKVSVFQDKHEFRSYSPSPQVSEYWPTVHIFCILLKAMFRMSLINSQKNSGFSKLCIYTYTGH